jgi:uncharacterized protein YcfJ
MLKMTKTRKIALSALAAATMITTVAAPVTASARDRYNNYACSVDRSNGKSNGAIIGAVAGAAIGNGVSARNAKTEGTILGAVLGAAVGSQVGKNAADCEPRYTSGYHNNGYGRPRYEYRHANHDRYDRHDRYDDRYDRRDRW